MAVITPRASIGGVHITPGTYIVTCVDTTEEEHDFGRGMEDYIRLDLEVDGFTIDGGEPAVLDALATELLSPKSKLMRWSRAFGCNPQIGVPFDTANLHGRKAQAVVYDKQSKDDPKVVYSAVSDIVALPQGMVSQPSAQQATPTPAPQAAPQQAAPDPGGETVGAWWARVRADGLKPADVNKRCGEMYGGREPKDLTSDERNALLLAMKGVPAAVPTVEQHKEETGHRDPTYSPEGQMVCAICGTELDDSLET